MGAVAAIRILHRRKLLEVAPDIRPQVEAELAAEHERIAGGVDKAVEIGVVDEVVEPAATRTALAKAIAGAGLVHARGARQHPAVGPWAPVSQGTQGNWHTPSVATAGVCRFSRGPRESAAWSGQARFARRNAVVRRIDSGQSAMNACGSPGVGAHPRVHAGGPRARRVARLQRIGHDSSAVPWWMSTGSVTRSKYGRGLTSRQNLGLSSGRPWSRAMRSASTLRPGSSRIHRSKLSRGRVS